MKCPYCIGEVDEAALVCPHCTRDLYLFKPLLAQLGALESELAKVKERLGKLETQRVESDTAAMSAGTIESSLGEAAPAEELGGASKLRQNIWLWLAPLALLVVAHILITIVFDINLVWLRMVSLLIPLPFGYLLMSSRFRRFPDVLLMAFLVACVAVVAMSGVVHLVDGAAIFPQDKHGWQEFIEYAASISFSFATGMVLGRREWRRQQAARLDSLLISRLVGLVMGSEVDIQKISSMVRTINDISRSIATSGTALAALYTGLHKFI